MIEEILKLAVNAPSGHNSQPWRFVIDENILFVWNVPDKDKILFNYEQRGSFIANGAVIENICIISAKNGYKTKVELFPEPSEENLVAKIEFTQERYDHFAYLADEILKRTTNRRPFDNKPLKPEHLDEVTKFVERERVGGSAAKITTDRQVIDRVAGPFSVGDRLIFENIHVHTALFANVNWSMEEEEDRREGLYVGTKELSPINKFLFKHFLSRWPLMEKLEKIRFSEKAAEKREKLYKQCSAMGIVFADGDSPTDFVESGRLLQRLWLFITSLGLSFQPVSIGLLYLGQWCKAEDPDGLSVNQIKLVNEAYDNILDAFKISKSTPTFSFRIGYSKPPTASSLKKGPEISYIER